MAHDVTKQAQYWMQFKQYKENCFYLHAYIAKDERHEWWRSFALAIGTSSAIGGWLVWKDVPYVWAVIIGVTQILQVASPLFPQRQRIKALHGMSVDLDNLIIKMEDEWHQVASGKLTDDAIHNLLMKYKTKQQAIFNAHLKGAELPDQPRLLVKARKSLDIFLSNQYPHTEPIHAK